MGTTTHMQEWTASVFFAASYKLVELWDKINTWNCMYTDVHWREVRLLQAVTHTRTLYALSLQFRLISESFLHVSV